MDIDWHALGLLALYLLSSTAPVALGWVFGWTSARQRYRTKKRRPRTMSEVIKLSTKTAPENQEREPFLEIDDVAYTLPVEPSPAIAVQYLRDTKARGSEYAVAAAFESMLGPAGLRALAKVGGLTKTDLAAIMKKIQDKLTGLLEEVSGN